MTAPRAKPTVPEVEPLIAAYYAKPLNGSGGSLHVVLDDGNIDRGCVEYGLRYALERGDDDGARIAELLLRMSMRQRAALCKNSGRTNNRLGRLRER